MLLCNVKACKVRSVVSQARLLCCSSSDDCIELLAPPTGSAPGDRVTFLNYPGNYGYSNEILTCLFSCDDKVKNKARQLELEIEFTLVGRPDTTGESTDPQSLSRLTMNPTVFLYVQVTRTESCSPSRRFGSFFSPTSWWTARVWPTIKAVGLK